VENIFEGRPGVIKTASGPTGMVRRSTTPYRIKYAKGPGGGVTHPVEWTRNLRSPIRPKKEAHWYKHATQDVRERQKLIERHCTALKKKIKNARSTTVRKEALLRHVIKLVRDLKSGREGKNTTSAVKAAFENLNVEDLERHLDQQRERGDSLSGDGVGPLSFSQIDQVDEEPSVTLLKAAEVVDYDDDDVVLEPSFTSSPELERSKFSKAVMGDTAAAVMTETALHVREVQKQKAVTPEDRALISLMKMVEGEEAAAAVVKEPSVKLSTRSKIASPSRSSWSISSTQHILKSVASAREKERQLLEKRKQREMKRREDQRKCICYSLHTHTNTHTYYIFIVFIHNQVQIYFLQSSQVQYHRRRRRRRRRRGRRGRRYQRV